VLAKAKEPTKDLSADKQIERKHPADTPIQADENLAF
jgi:hypothetical protein